MRDLQITKIAEEQGWTVLRFWEHEINENLFNVVSQINIVLADLYAQKRSRPLNVDEDLNED